MNNERNVRRVTVGASAVVILIGAGALFGWIFDIATLKSLLPGLATMKVNTAAAFVLAGIALNLRINPKSATLKITIARVCAMLTMTVGVLTLIEYLFHVDLSIDNLFHLSIPEAGIPFQGRMAPNSALSLSLFGTALLLLDRPNLALRRLSEILVLVVFFFGLVAVIGYVLSVNVLYGVPGYAAMAVHTAVAFILLSIGVLAARPQRGIASIVLQDNPAGAAARRVLPLTIGALLVIAWLRLKGQYAGLYGTEFGLALMVTAASVVVASIVLWSAKVQGIAEKDRRELQQRMTALIESAEDAIVTKDLNGIVRSWNPAAEQILGYSADAIIGTSMMQLLPRDRQHEEALILDQIRQGKRVSHFETVRRRKDGSLVDVSLTISPLRDGAGNIVGASKIMRDITERKCTEDAVRASEQRYRFMSETMPQILWTSKSDGSPDFFNQRWFAYTGLTVEESKDWSGWQRAVHPDDLQSVSERWNQAFSTGGEYVAEYRFRRAADGAYRWQLGRASPFRNADGVIIHWVGTCTDIHDYKEAEAKNLALQAELEERVQQRTAANLTLAHSNARFETLVRLTSQVIWTNNPEGRMEGVQPGWGAFTGQSFDDYQGFGWAAAVHPDDAQPTIDEWNRCVADRRAFLFEHRVRRHDGIYRICTINGTPVLNDDGAIREWVGVHIDITERRQQEDEIRAQEEKFRFLAESLPQMVWTALPDGGLDYFNQRWCSYTGMTLEQTLGWGWGPVLHPDDLQNCIRVWSHSVATGEPLEIEYRFRRASDDTYRWHLGRALPFRDAHGAIVKWFGTSTDIHDYKEAEAKNLALQAELEDRVQQRMAELERVGKRFALAADAAGIGVWEWDLLSNALRWDDQMYRLYGRMPVEGEEPYSLWATSLHAEDRGRAEREINESLRDGMNFDTEFRIVQPSGEIRHLKADAKIQRDAAGAAIRMIGVNFDITARKQAELDLQEAKSEAERANAAKSEFLANMSHEIRTPLNAVIGLGYLLEQTTLSENQHQFLTKIQFAGRSLLSVVNNVLDLSKIEAGEVSLEDQSLDLPELFLDTSQMLAPQATAKGIELIVQPTTDLPRLVIGDVSRLRQILFNLLSNAIKFTDTGHVELKAYCTEQGSDRIRLRCEVIDTGIGMEPAAVKRMFVPFAQADASTTRRFGGTGLGLSIARHLVELMGGEIDATSTIAVGSTFWFEIPLRIAHSVDTTVSARGLRVAIVDSGSDAMGSLTGMVRALGWSPHVVPTGEQLLSFLSSAQPNAWPHLLIAQLQSSDMDAHQLIVRLENAYPHSDVLPVIFVTDCAESYLTHQPLMRSTDVLLVLPLTSSALFNAANTAISKQPDGRDHMLQFTATDVLHAQWLIGVRVLVVDDNAVNREVAQGILQSQGAIVSTCSDGRAALEHVRVHHQQLDVVLMDVQMPILDGNEATRLIRSELNLQSLPIVALTAGALASERQRALEAGMNDIVTKPFDPQVLIRKVRYLAEQARNEPIPIAILDSKLALHPADGPLPSSIDADVVKQMFGEDLPLFKSALSGILRDYVEFAVPISASLDDQVPRSQLRARIHELRGSAGLIGATRVMRLAGEAETALEKGRSIDAVGPILGRLTSAFSEMRGEAEFWLARQVEREVLSDAKAAPRPNIDTADVDDLYALLDSRNLAALDKFRLLSPSLNELLGAVRFDRLRDAMDNLDFPLGARLLRESPIPA